MQVPTVIGSKLEQFRSESPGGTSDSVTLEMNNGLFNVAETSNTTQNSYFERQNGLNKDFQEDSQDSTINGPSSNAWKAGEASVDGLGIDSCVHNSGIPLHHTKVANLKSHKNLRPLFYSNANDAVLLNHNPSLSSTITNGSYEEPCKPPENVDKKVVVGESEKCANCKTLIRDKFLLKAEGKYWHEDCLKCSCCDCRLGEVGSSFFLKANLFLCKRDYLRLFGSTGFCTACERVIPAFEMVMKARGNVYHLECFACQECNHRFCVGDKYYLWQNRILCERDYEDISVAFYQHYNYQLQMHQNEYQQSLYQSTPREPNHIPLIDDKYTSKAAASLDPNCSMAFSYYHSPSALLSGPKPYANTQGSKSERYARNNMHPHLHHPDDSQAHKQASVPQNYAQNYEEDFSGAVVKASQANSNPNILYTTFASDESNKYEGRDDTCNKAQQLQNQQNQQLFEMPQMTYHNFNGTNHDTWLSSERYEPAHEYKRKNEWTPNSKGNYEFKRKRKNYETGNGKFYDENLAKLDNNLIYSNTNNINKNNTTSHPSQNTLKYKIDSQHEFSTSHSSSKAFDFDSLPNYGADEAYRDLNYSRIFVESTKSSPTISNNLITSKNLSGLGVDNNPSTLETGDDVDPYIANLEPDHYSKSVFPISNQTFEIV